MTMLVRLKRWKADSDANGGNYCQEKQGVGASKVSLQRWKRSVNCFGPEYSSDCAGDGPMKHTSELAEVLSAQQIVAVLEQCRRLQALRPRYRAMCERESMNIADKESKCNAERTMRVLKYSGTQLVAASCGG